MPSAQPLIALCVSHINRVWELHFICFEHPNIYEFPARKSIILVEA